MNVCAWIPIGLVLLWNYFLPADANALLQPPSRGLLYTRNIYAPPTYNYMDLNCGGIGALRRNDGKCGMCGDPYDRKRKHEYGGDYYTGKVSHYYTAGERYLDVKIMLNSESGGRFEFRLCNPSNGAESEECFDKNVLAIQEGIYQGTRLSYVPRYPGLLNLNLLIPEGLSCERCILQWKYITGKTWGRDATGHMCTGCGPQDTFVNCADIKIDGWEDPFKVLPPPPTTVPPPTTAAPFPSTVGLTTPAATPPPTTPKPIPVTAVRWVRPQDKDEAPARRQLFKLPDFQPFAGVALPYIPVPVESPVAPVPVTARPTTPKALPSPDVPGIAVPLSFDTAVPEATPIDSNSSPLRSPYRASGPNLIPRPPMLSPAQQDALRGTNGRTTVLVAPGTPQPPMPRVFVPKPRPTVNRRKPTTVKPTTAKPKPSIQKIFKPPPIEPSTQVIEPSNEKNLFDIQLYKRGPPSGPPPPPKPKITRPSGVLAEYGVSSQTEAPTLASWPKDNVQPLESVAPNPTVEYVIATQRPSVSETRTPMPTKARQPFRRPNTRFIFSTTKSPVILIQESKRSITYRPDTQYHRYALSSVPRERDTVRKQPQHTTKQRRRPIRPSETSNWRGSGRYPMSGKTAKNDFSPRSLNEAYLSASASRPTQTIDPQYSRYDLSASSFQNKPKESQQTELQIPKTSNTMSPGLMKDHYQTDPSSQVTPGWIRDTNERRYNVRSYGTILNNERFTSGNTVRHATVEEITNAPIEHSKVTPPGSNNARIYSILYNSDKSLSARYPGLGVFEDQTSKPKPREAARVKTRTANSGFNQELPVEPGSTQRQGKQRSDPYHQENHIFEHSTGQNIDANVPDMMPELPNLGVPVRLRTIDIKTKKQRIETTTEAPVVITTTTKKPERITTKKPITLNDVQDMQTKLLLMIAAERTNGGNSGKPVTPSKDVLQAMREYMQAKAAVSRTEGNVTPAQQKPVVPKFSKENNVNLGIKGNEAVSGQVSGPEVTWTASQRRIAEQEKQIRLLKEQQKALQDKLVQARVAQEERDRQKQEQLLQEQKRKQEEDAKKKEQLRRSKLRAFIRKQIKQRRKMERERAQQQQQLKEEQARLLKLQQEQEAEKRRQKEMEAQRQIQIQREQERLRLLEIAKQKEQETQRLLEMKRQHELERKRLLDIKKRKEVKLQQQKTQRELQKIQQQQELERLRTERIQKELEREKMKMLEIQRQIENERKLIQKMSQDQSFLTNSSQDIKPLSSIDTTSQNVPLLEELSPSKKSHMVEMTSVDTSSMIPSPENSADQWNSNSPKHTKVSFSNRVIHRNTNDYPGGLPYNLPVFDNVGPLPPLNKPILGADHPAVDTAVNRFSYRLSKKMTEYNTSQTESSSYPNVEIVPLSKSSILNILTSIASNVVSGLSDGRNNPSQMVGLSPTTTEQMPPSVDTYGHLFEPAFSFTGGEATSVVSPFAHHSESSFNRRVQHSAYNDSFQAGRNGAIPEQMPSLHHLQIQHLDTKPNPAPALMEMNSINDIRIEQINNKRAEFGVNSNRKQQTIARTGGLTKGFMTYSENQQPGTAQGGTTDTASTTFVGHDYHFPGNAFESLPQNGKVQALFAVPGSHGHHLHKPHTTTQDVGTAAGNLHGEFNFGRALDRLSQTTEMTPTFPDMNRRIDQSTSHTFHADGPKATVQRQFFSAPGSVMPQANIPDAHAPSTQTSHEHLMGITVPNQILASPPLSDVRPPLPDVKLTRPDVRPPLPDVKLTRLDVRPPLPEVRSSTPDVRPSLPDVRPSLPDVRPSLPDMKPTLPDVRPPLSDVRPPLPDLRLPRPDVRPPLSDVSPPLSDVAQKLLMRMNNLRRSSSQNNGGNSNKLLVVPINRASVMEMLERMSFPPISQKRPLP